MQSPASPIGDPRSGRHAGLVLGVAMVAAMLAAVPPARAADQPAGAACQEAIPDLYDRVSPAVVSITARSINPYQPTERVTHVVGSGVIIDPKGLILTNAHVVFGRQAIVVTLDDGTNLPGQLVGADPIFDIALVRIPAPTSGTLPTATPGDSDHLRVGEEVLAIGNPLGLDQTLTRGIVSGINRILPNTALSLMEPLIQTDAPINPGNSGGPLVNRCGEIVGITTAILPEAQNIGFAIPINLVKSMLPELLRNGRIIRPWLGFQAQLVGRPLREILRLPLVDGLMVEVVDPGGPAEKAGIHGGEAEVMIGDHTFLVGGDIVTGINEIRVNAPDNLVQAMQGLKVGMIVRLTVFRDGTYREVSYELPERPLLPADTPGRESLPILRGLNHRP